MQGQGKRPFEADFDEAKEAIISCCTKAVEKFPRHRETPSRMILNASANFPDLTSTPKRRLEKSKSSFMLEEEERTSRQVEKEEWQELHPPGTTIQA